MKTFEEFLTEGFAIKHKKTGEVLSTHDNESDANDEHSGLENKEEYKVVKSSSKPKKFSMKEDTILEKATPLKGSISIKGAKGTYLGVTHVMDYSPGLGGAEWSCHDENGNVLAEGFISK